MGKQSKLKREKWVKMQEAQEKETARSTGRFYDYLHSFRSMRQEVEAVRQFYHDVSPLSHELENAFTFFAQIENAIVIDCSSLLDSFTIRNDRVEYPPELFGIRLPFEKTFIEFNRRISMGDDHSVEVTRIGLLLENDEHDPLVFHCKAMAHHAERDVTWYLGQCSVVTDEQGNVIGYNDEYVDTKHWDMSQFLSALSLTLVAVEVMNCRNVVFVENTASPLQSGIYSRHFGAPLTKYRTLAIKSMSTRAGRDDKPQRQFDVMPLHLRRGNFARYTDDAPLFGKFTGTFWRPATVVGSEKNGVVAKDYEVQA